MYLGEKEESRNLLASTTELYIKYPELAVQCLQVIDYGLLFPYSMLRSIGNVLMSYMMHITTQLSSGYCVWQLNSLKIYICPWFCRSLLELPAREYWHFSFPSSPRWYYRELSLLAPLTSTSILSFLWNSSIERLSGGELERKQGETVLL